MHNKIVFSGGTLVTPTRVVQADLVVEGSTIKGIRESGQVQRGEEVVDCEGLTVGPGLVDIHVHGGAGHDFLTEDPGEVIKGVEYHLSQGTTSIIPSALSVPIDEMDKAIESARSAAPECAADILGFHVEGIYVDQTYRGGHLAEYVHNPVPKEYEPLIAKHADFITEWTLAPELPGALDLIAACREADIVTSAGHSQATYEQMLAAVDAGLSHSTHFVCVMGALRFEALRESTGKGYAPGVVETILLHDGITTEVIADGFHLHPAIIRLALKCKGPHSVCLVSDAMKGVGLPDGEYYIGGQDCVVQGGIAIIKERPEVIASSVTPLIGMLRFTHREVGIPLNDAWTMASLTPSKVLRVEKRKGSLAPGKDADILLLDENLAIKSVYARGKRVDVSSQPGDVAIKG